VQALEGGVIGLTQEMVGAHGAVILRNVGADVIEVEPATSRQTRRPSSSAMSGRDSAAFLAISREERGITLGLTTETDCEALVALGPAADTHVEQFLADATDRLGDRLGALRRLCFAGRVDDGDLVDRVSESAGFNGGVIALLTEGTARWE
jgi:crotonobetainyl-CoA:carnitine CoA-transferase CaiB-like acyl-CoA transferase